MLYGRGAGALPTGSAVVSDIVFCARQIEHARYSTLIKALTFCTSFKDSISDIALRMLFSDDL